MATKPKIAAKRKPTAKPAVPAAGAAPLKLKLIRIGTSTGVVIPKPLLDRLQLRRGDVLTVTELPTGLQLSIGDADEQVMIGRAFMMRYGAVFRALAKL